MKKLITSVLLMVLTITLSACSTEDITIDELLQATDTVLTNETTLDEYDINVNYNDTSLDGDTEDDELDDEESENEYGSAGALVDTSFTIEEMLLYAIQDEYAARQEYDYILNTFDVTKPFSNIILSEETHISLLIPLFETYGFVLPEDTSSEHVISISSLEEAFNIGVIAEINNIDMYNLFLEQDDLPDDIKDVFIKLRDASENHLSAFEKNAAKY